MMKKRERASQARARHKLDTNFHNSEMSNARPRDNVLFVVTAASNEIQFDFIDIVAIGIEC